MIRAIVVCLVLAVAGPVVAETVRVDLRLANALQLGGAKEWQRLAHVSLIFEDGVLRSGRVGPFDGGLIGGWSTVAWTGRFDGGDLRLEGDRLTGTMKAYVTSNEVGRGEHAFTIDADLKDGKATGRFTAVHGDAQTAGGVNGVYRQIVPVPADAEDGLMVLALDGALPRGEVLKVYLDRQGGGYRAAFAFATPFSRRPFEIDATGLTLKDGELSGTVNVIRNVTRTRIDPLLGSYQVRAKIAGDRISGSHAGRFGDDEGDGDVWGEVLPRPEVPHGAVQVSMKLEDGLFGGADWQNRAFFDFSMNMGKAETGKLSNNKGVYRGRFAGAELTLTEDRVRGHIVGTVLDGDVTPGRYTFDIDGPKVGNYFMGVFTTRLGDQTKQGYFVGTLGP